MIQDSRAAVRHRRRREESNGRFRARRKTEAVFRARIKKGVVIHEGGFQIAEQQEFKVVRLPEWGLGN
jgi:hypothetical protein